MKITGPLSSFGKVLTTDRPRPANTTGATLTTIHIDPAFDISEPVVRSLLAAQHPDLADLPLRRVDGGFDNRLWRLGEDLAVRLPQTENAPFLLARERQWLPALAPRLPLPVPVPVRAGEPSEHFPRPWSVVRWVAGEPADRVPPSRGAESAAALAGFLKALHQPAPSDAPLTSYGAGVPLEEAKTNPSHWEEFGSAELRAVWDDALAAPAWTGPPVWLHGDLHPANVVVTDGALAGIIDFGDVCSGDPATDLAAAWLLLPSGAAAAFFEAYGAVDDATIRRARGWAVLRAFGLIAIGVAGNRGLPGGKPTWGPAGRGALERVLADRGGFAAG